MLSNEDIVFIKKAEEGLGLEFNDKTLLFLALTHRSVLQDGPSEFGHNERLEFFGDSVLSIVASEALYQQIPKADEGTLTKLRASYVCEGSLAQGARSLGLGVYIRTGKNMRASGSVDLDSVLADALEAVFAAVYLDQGYEAAQQLVFRSLGPVPLKTRLVPKDAKTQLQELIQSTSLRPPTYRVLSQMGQAHAPVFRVEILIQGKVVGEGAGSSKKDAAQEAAKEVLKTIGDLRPAQISLWFENI